MNILHITAHLGDGAGKAIGGLARMGNREGKHTHRILMLEQPKKLNHVSVCMDAGVEVFGRERLDDSLRQADVIVINWWGGKAMDSFLAEYPTFPCKTLLWSHVNGVMPPKFPGDFPTRFDGLVAASQFTPDNVDWEGELVYGIGDFSPEDVAVKTGYAINNGVFKIGYVGMPGYKRFPSDCMDYFKEVVRQIPHARFVMAGETSDEFKQDVKNHGLERYFEFRGWVDNVRELMPTFDVFGYLMRPDTTATTENSVIEAMAAGLPCVVSKRPIGKYLLEDGVSGFLEDSPMKYAHSMVKLYDSMELRRQVGHSARDYTVEKYNAKDNLQRFNKAIVHKKR